MRSFDLLVLSSSIALLRLSVCSALANETNATVQEASASTQVQNVTEVVMDGRERNTSSPVKLPRPLTGMELREHLKSANVSICSVVKNEQLYVDEWLHYHRYLGFDSVHLHDNAPIASTYMAGLPEKYGSFVTVSHTPGLGMQVPAYKRCIAENAHANMWTAFMDLDEFIVLRNHSNIKAFLQDVAPDGGSVVLNWHMMRSNGSMTYDPAPVVTRFTLTTIVPNQHIKTIAYLPHVKGPNVHNCYLKPGHPTVDQHGRNVSHTSPFHPNNDHEVAYLNHYYTKSWEEFKLKRRRGFASNFKKNEFFANTSAETMQRIAKDYENANRMTNNLVHDMAARDFYLGHLLKSTV